MGTQLMETHRKRHATLSIALYRNEDSRPTTRLAYWKLVADPGPSGTVQVERPDSVTPGDTLWLASVEVEPVGHLPVGNLRFERYVVPDAPVLEFPAALFA